MSASSSMTRSSRQRRRARRGNPLSHLRCQLSQRESHWRVGSGRAGRAKFFAVGNGRAPLLRFTAAAAAHSDKARRLAPHWACANSRAGPACQCLALRERWQCAALTERVSPAAAAHSDKARHLAPHRAQANSRAGPACQCLALRERWQCAALTERVSPAAASRFPGGGLP